MGKRNSSVLVLSAVTLWSQFRRFSCIYTHLIKSYENFLTYNWSFSNIFNICENISISNCSNLWRCYNFLLKDLPSTGSCYILFVLFLRKKKKKYSTRFNPYLSVLTKFSYFRDISRISHIYDELIKTDALQGINLHFSNTVVLTIPCATFYYDSCSITKVKTERDAHFPLSTYSKRMFKKRTSNRIDEKPLASRHWKVYQNLNAL